MTQVFNEDTDRFEKVEVLTHEAEMAFVRLMDLMGELQLATEIDKGFRPEGKPGNDGEWISLIHSELSEALEGIRTGDPWDVHCPEFTSAEIEMADAVIRIMGGCKARHLRLGEAILAKMAYNKTRPERHGGKLF